MKQSWYLFPIIIIGVLHGAVIIHLPHCVVGVVGAVDIVDVHLLEATLKAF